MWGLLQPPWETWSGPWTPDSGLPGGEPVVKDPPKVSVSNAPVFLPCLLWKRNGLPPAMSEEERNTLLWKVVSLFRV